MMRQAARGPDRGWALHRVWQALYGPRYLNDYSDMHRCKSARPSGRSGARAAARKRALFRAGEEGERRQQAIYGACLPAFRKMAGCITIGKTCRMSNACARPEGGWAAQCGSCRKCPLLATVSLEIRPWRVLSRSCPGGHGI